MFASNERVRPCRARSSPRSVGRLTTSVPSSCETCIRAGTDWESSPNGPFTWTRPGLMATFTPLGSSIGCFPIRLNGFSFWWKCAAFSPDKADNFAADALLLGGAARDQAVGGGQDRDAHAAEHAGKPVLACVDAASRLRDALQVRDHPLAAAAELEVDDERLVRPVIVLVRMRIVPRVRRLDVVVADVALLLEQAGGLLFYPRVRHLDPVVPRPLSLS